MTMKEKLNLHGEIEEANKQKEKEWKENTEKMENSAVLIKTDGTISVASFPEDDLIGWCYKKIGCDLVEIVRPMGLPEGYVLVVDEEGLLVDQPVLNVIGSYLYGFTDHGNPICGNIILMKEEETEDGCSLAGMTEKEARNWQRKFRMVLPLTEWLVAGVLNRA